MAEILKLKIKQFQDAVKTLKEIDFSSRDRIVRDAAIQRFEYTAEIFWKVLKVYLFYEESIDVYSPKQVIRESRNVGILEEEELIKCIEMIEHRNLSSHIYNVKIADDIYTHIPEYVVLMENIIQKVEEKFR